MGAREIEKRGRGAKILLKQVPDPKEYGVPTFRGKRIVKITEKPKKPASQKIRRIGSV